MGLHPFEGAQTLYISLQNHIIYPTNGIIVSRILCMILSFT
jgi:hypothetical protein